MSQRKPKRVRVAGPRIDEIPSGYQGASGYRYHPRKGFRLEKGYVTRGRITLDPRRLARMALGMGG